MAPVALPYLFSPANLPQAGGFLESFQAVPSAALVRYPNAGESPTALAAAATVLGSAIRLSEEQGTPPWGWQVMACEPAEVTRTKSLFCFEDGITPKKFGGQAAFESHTGQFVSVLWSRNEEAGLSVGWAWEGVMALQQALLPTDGGPARMAYEIRFESRFLDSLRKFLNVNEGGLEPLVRAVGDAVLASGLIAAAKKEDMHLMSEKGEVSPWIPLRTDYLSAKFPKNSYVSVVASTTVSIDKRSNETVQAESVGLRVGSPHGHPLSLPPALMRLWDLAQHLSMARAPVSRGRPS